MSGTSEDGKAGGAHPPASAQAKTQSEEPEAAPGEAKGEEGAASEGRDPEAGAGEEAETGGDADASGDAEAGGAAAGETEAMPGDGEVSGPGAEAPGKGEPPGAPGWTAESIERLLKTVDSVSADAAETKSMLDTLTDLRGQGEARAIVEARERMRVYAADFHRSGEAGSLRRRRWRAAALAVAVPAALLLGLLAQKEFDVVPMGDPSRGWSAWIWETQGRAIVACALEAIRTDSEVDCPLVVRRP